MVRALPSFGPGSQRQGRRVGLLSPWPQAPQAAPARPRPPLLARGLRAGMQAHTSRRSRERGLGQTQSLRSRSSVAVQQVLGTPSRHGQARGRQLTYRGTRVYPRRCEPTAVWWGPASTDPRQGPQPLPSCTDGGTEAPGTGRSCSATLARGGMRQPRGPGREEFLHHPMVLDPWAKV